jgi:hypothetical protein
LFHRTKRTKEEILADNDGSAGLLSLFVGLLLALFIGTGLLTAGADAQGKRTLKIESVKTE